jgi:hypothetical protein
MREPRATTTVQRDRTAPTTPRPARPAGSPGQPTSWTPEAAPEQRPDRRFRGSSDRGGGGGYASKNEDRPKNRNERSRRGRDSADDEWRSVRGDPRNYYSYSEDTEEEPAPTTAEELVARFGRKDANK